MVPVSAQRLPRKEAEALEARCVGGALDMRPYIFWGGFKLRFRAEKVGSFGCLKGKYRDFVAIKYRGVFARLSDPVLHGSHWVNLEDLQGTPIGVRWLSFAAIITMFCSEIRDKT